MATLPRQGECHELLKGSGLVAPSSSNARRLAIRVLIARRRFLWPLPAELGGAAKRGAAFPWLIGEDHDTGNFRSRNDHQCSSHRRF
jgi:hypothetical protein